MSATREISGDSAIRTALAFDFGKQRIGVAVGQELSATAQPLTTLQVRDGSVDWAAITRLVDEWQPDYFVLGDPRGDHASSHPLHAALMKFERRLEGRFHRPVHWIDERLSSDEARRRGGHKTSAGLDAVAAEVILETWFAELDTRSETP